LKHQQKSWRRIEKTKLNSTNYKTEIIVTDTDTTSAAAATTDVAADVAVAAAAVADSADKRPAAIETTA